LVIEDADVNEVLDQIAGDVKAETMVMAKDVPPGEWFRADVKLRDLPMTVMIQKM
jgi:phenylpyruvate tautomerase PptA (4-oxalocrotonate tautomerase family)